MNYTNLSLIKSLGGTDSHFLNNDKTTKIMKTEHILPATGAFTLGFFLGIFLFICIFLPQYQREVNRVHYADQVIEECIKQYPAFYDTIAEGDAWGNYIKNKQ